MKHDVDESHWFKLDFIIDLPVSVYHYYYNTMIGLLSVKLHRKYWSLLLFNKKCNYLPINDSNISMISFLVLSSWCVWLKWSWLTMFLNRSCKGFNT